jgi:cobalt/nickel transport system permease protein
LDSVRHLALDRYWQGTSSVHRLDPRLKLVAVLAYVLVTSSVPARGCWAFLALGGLALGAALASEIPLSAVLKRSMIVMPFAGMAAVSLPFTRTGEIVWAWCPFGWTLAVTDQGLLAFVSVVVKAWLSGWVGGLLVATTPFPSLLMAMSALHVPSALTTILSFTYRYLHVLVEEAMRLQTAREARSAGPGGSVAWRVRVLGGMIGSLFVRSYERSERIYAAMLSRGFSGQMRSLSKLAWCAPDTWTALGWGAVLVAIAVVGWVPC